MQIAKERLKLTVLLAEVLLGGLASGAERIADRLVGHSLYHLVATILDLIHDFVFDTLHAVSDLFKNVPRLYW